MSDWYLSDDPDFERQSRMARFFYRLCDITFEIAEWFAWRRFE